MPSSPPIIQGQRRPTCQPCRHRRALRLRVAGTREVLSLISMTMVFGTPVDVTLSELALECFFPADEPTRAALQRDVPNRIGPDRIQTAPS